VGGEIHSPLALVILLLGTNDLQSMHPHDAWHAAQGIATLVTAIRQAPIEPGMAIPPVLVVAPPPGAGAAWPDRPQVPRRGGEGVGLAGAYREVATALGCAFFDAAAVTVPAAPAGGRRAGLGRDGLGTGA
jgi:lysophospholipase L1-like esterase